MVIYRHKHFLAYRLPFEISPYLSPFPPTHPGASRDPGNSLITGFRFSPEWSRISSLLFPCHSERQRRIRYPYRHCEERSDVAISFFGLIQIRDCHASLAMTSPLFSHPSRCKSGSSYYCYSLVSGFRRNGLVHFTIFDSCLLYIYNSSYYEKDITPNIFQ